MRDISTAQYRYRYYTEGLIWAFGDTEKLIGRNVRVSSLSLKIPELKPEMNFVRVFSD